MSEFEKIYLIWRKGQGERRLIAGVLEKTPRDTYVFEYTDEAKENPDFSPYPEFQDMNKIYEGNVADIFGQRLTKADRPDIRTFLDFWEVDDAFTNDKFYLLGKTQGLVATDNFEFLADYHLNEHTHFLTEVASLSKQPLLRDSVSRGDILRFELEPENAFDKHAVKLYKADLLIGYVKKIHNSIFYKPGAEHLKVQVKAVEQNGFIKRIFIKVCYE